MILIDKQRWYTLYKLEDNELDIFNQVQDYSKSFYEAKVKFKPEENKIHIVEKHEDIFQHVNNYVKVTNLLTGVKSPASEYRSSLDNCFLHWSMQAEITIPPHCEAKIMHEQQNNGYLAIPLQGVTEYRSYGRMPSGNPHYNETQELGEPTNQHQTCLFEWHDYQVVDFVECHPGQAIVINSTKFITSIHAVTDTQRLQFSVESFE